MDQKLKEYLDSGQYIPDFMRDFHDQKTVFKRLNEMVKNRDDSYTKDINWTSAQVYVIDIFLWYMAAHGYTLQRSRKQTPFYDIHHDLHEFEEKMREESTMLLKKVIEERMQPKDGN